MAELTVVNKVNEAKWLCLLHLGTILLLENSRRSPLLSLVYLPNLVAISKFTLYQKRGARGL
jgi:hypothetical protein